MQCSFCDKKFTKNLSTENYVTCVKQTKDSTLVKVLVPNPYGQNYIDAFIVGEITVRACQRCILKSKNVKYSLYAIIFCLCLFLSGFFFDIMGLKVLSGVFLGGFLILMIRSLMGFDLSELISEKKICELPENGFLVLKDDVVKNN